MEVPSEWSASETLTSACEWGCPALSAQFIKQLKHNKS